MKLANLVFFGMFLSAEAFTYEFSAKGELCASGHDVIDKNECQIATDTLKPNDGVIVNQIYRNDIPPLCAVWPNLQGVWWNTHPTLVGDFRANYYTSLCRVEKTVTVTENPTSAPTKKLIIAPTKKVNDYELLLKSAIFNKDDKIEVLYSVTDIDKISDMSFKIYKTGCIEEIDDTSVQAAGKSYDEGEDGSTAEAEITLTKENLSVSGYVAAGSSDSVGEVNFCVKAEIYDMVGTDRISASFLSKNFKIEYDLSSNSFTVGTMDIEALGLGDTEVDKIETEYTIKADRCGATGTPTSTKLFQTSLLHICIEPVASDIKIDHFEMSFYQTVDNTNNVEQFKAIAPNSVTNGFTSISGEGIKNSPKIVTSRLVSKLFEDGRTTFAVKGVASLKFIANQVDLRRSLENLTNSDRQLQNDQGTVNSSFSLDIELEKYSNTSTIKNESTTFTVVAVFGGCLTISIVFIIFKKMNST